MYLLPNGRVTKNYKIVEQQYNAMIYNIHKDFYEFLGSSVAKNTFSSIDEYVKFTLENMGLSQFLDSYEYKEYMSSNGMRVKVIINAVVVADLSLNSVTIE